VPPLAIEQYAFESCRSGALHLKGFDNDQIFAQIFSLSEAV